MKPFWPSALPWQPEVQYYRDSLPDIRTVLTKPVRDASPDQQKVDELSNQVLWETRIFEDRRKVVKYVCEVPTAIDQRLFALGRVIQQEME